MADRDQQRAVSAYRAIQNVADANRKEFRSAARKLPATMQSCGLLQTFAFYQKDRKMEVRGKIVTWLCARPEFAGDLAGGNDIVELLAALSQEKYRMVAAEALEYATWIKRATDGWPT